MTIKVRRLPVRQPITRRRTYYQELPLMGKISLTTEQLQWLKGKGKLRVYVSDTGIRYHNRYCPALRRSKHQISLREVIWQGFSPCRVCKPPDLAPLSELE